MPLKLNPADGVRLSQFKEQSFSRPLFRLRSPETVFVPLFAFGAGSMLPIPRVGESVAKNSMLARTRNSQSWVVSPVSGKLLRIERREHPMMGSVLCAVIAVRDSLPALDVKGHNPHSMTPMGIVQAARMACIIDEVDGLPLYYKLMKGMKDIAPQDRAAYGKSVNALKEWALEFDPDFGAKLAADPAYATSILAIGRGGKKPRKDLAVWKDAKDYMGFFYDELWDWMTDTARVQTRTTSICPSAANASTKRITSRSESVRISPPESSTSRTRGRDLTYSTHADNCSGVRTTSALSRRPRRVQ